MEFPFFLETLPAIWNIASREGEVQILLFGRESPLLRKGLRYKGTTFSYLGLFALGPASEPTMPHWAGERVGHRLFSQNNSPSVGTPTKFEANRRKLRKNFLGKNRR
ncbi:hypothetical protein AVEN_227185-1 [Araneus ventricosus]|uniref:Uncharacterized protein n=1 Tax=Araneus ventricosus TaxID=182803 RepID=A0A4Y2A800_ARAVE|nr:hypothetical protein AVEN_227185-1 [Araneus ventricosus]